MRKADCESCRFQVSRIEWTVEDRGESLHFSQDLAQVSVVGRPRGM